MGQSENPMARKIITAFLTVGAVPKTGLSPTVTILQLDPLVPATFTTIVNAAPMTEVANGWYRYDLTTYDRSQNYTITVDAGANTCFGERYQATVNESYQDDIADATWEEPAASHLNLGTTGFVLNQIKSDTTSIIISVAAATTLIQTLLKYEKNRTRIDTFAKTLTIYDDDCVTPLEVFDLLDSTGSPSVTEVCERKPVTCP